MNHRERTSDPAPLLTKRPRLIRGMFSSVAGSYDLLNRLLSLWLDILWRRLAVRLAGAGPGRRVLDVCCGTGDLSIAFTRRRAARVVGLDFSGEMLSLASRKIGRRPIALIQGDVLALPFADRSFDVVAVAFGLRNIDALPRAVSEMVRVTRDGGKVVVLELSRPTGPLLGALHRAYLRLVLPNVARAVARSGAGAYRYLALSVIGFSDETLATEMRRCGLQGISRRTLTGGAACILTGVKPEPENLSPERGPTT